MVALVQVPLMSWGVVKDVDRREVVEVSATVGCPSVGLLGISILCILLPPDYDSALTTYVSMLFFWHPLLSNGLVAIGNLRASCPFSDSLVEGMREPPKLGILL